MYHLTLADDKKSQFLNVLNSFRENVKMVKVYIFNEANEFKAFNYLSMSYSDFNFMRQLYYNHLLYAEVVENLFKAYFKFKEEIEFIITCSGRKDYYDVNSLYKECMKAIDELEKIYQQDTNN